jgi:basic membrane protein A
MHLKELLGSSLKVAAFATLVALGLSCGDDDQNNQTPTEKLKVAFVYIGTPGDAGWTYAHDLGVQKAAAEFTDVEVSYKENVSEDLAGVTAAVDELVAKGNKLIFTTSFGFMDPTYAMAEKYPDVKFEHCSGYKTRENMASYFGRMYQARYLTGMVAGRMTTANKIGYVAAFPIPEVIRMLDAFTLGVRKVNPQATVEVMWTNTWYNPAVEGQTATALLDKGCDVLAQHQDSTATILAAQARGAMAIGYNSDMVGFAPDTVLTDPIWHWEVYYKDRIQAVKDGTWQSQSYWGSIATGIVDVGPYSSKVPQAVKDEVAAAKADLVAGTYDVFWGPIKKQDGTLMVDQGAKMSDADMLSLMDLVEGVVGTVPTE